MTARALADSFRKFSASAATVALAWHVGEHVRMDAVGKNISDRETTVGLASRACGGQRRAAAIASATTEVEVIQNRARIEE